MTQPPCPPLPLSPSVLQRLESAWLEAPGQDVRDLVDLIRGPVQGSGRGPVGAVSIGSSSSSRSSSSRSSSSSSSSSSSRLPTSRAPPATHYEGAGTGGGGGGAGGDEQARPSKAERKLARDRTQAVKKTQAPSSDQTLRTTATASAAMGRQKAVASDEKRAARRAAPVPAGSPAVSRGPPNAPRTKNHKNKDVGGLPLPPSPTPPLEMDGRIRPSGVPRSKKKNKKEKAREAAAKVGTGI